MRAYFAFCVMVLCGMTLAEEDYQEWSEQTYIDERFSFTCNDTIYTVFINPNDRLTWRRHGHDAPLVNDDHFEISEASGIPNMQLTIKRVTDEMKGIYFCEVHAPNGDFVARVVKGLNIGGHKYHKFMDKYERSLITGVITGMSVLFLVVATCAIDHFRYQSDEERLERREAKEERIRRMREMKNGGHDNLGMEVTVSGKGSGKHGLEHHGNFNKGFHNEVNTQL